MGSLEDLFFPGQKVKKIKSLGNLTIWHVWDAQNKKLVYQVEESHSWAHIIRFKTDKITKAREYLKKYASY